MNLLRKSLWGVWAVSAICVLIPMHVFAQYGANVCISVWTNRIESPTVSVSSVRFACVLEPVMFTARIDPARSKWLDVACGRLRPDDVGSVIATTWVWNVRGNTAPNPSGGTGSVAVFTNNALGVGRVSFEGSGTYTVDGQTHSFTLTQDSPDFQVVDRMIAMDGNQDLQIEFNSTNDNHCTFWVNDDYDVRHWVGDGSADGWAEDDDEKEASSIRNCDDDFFGRSTSNNCLRDLEDFTVVQFKVPSVISNLTGVTYWLRFDSCANGNPSANLFWAITNRVAGPFDYLTNSMVASNQVKEIRAVTNLGSIAQEISTNYIHCYDQPIGFLLEGRTPGKGKLTFIVKQGASEICRSSVSLDLQCITNFYDRFYVGTVTHTNTFKIFGHTFTRTTTPNKWEVEVTANADPVQTTTAYVPDPAKYLLLVHGWNVSPDEKKSFAETAFKRLWWQGYKGGFGFFDWPTLCGYPNATSLLHNYDDSEMMAWLSSTALARLMEELNASGCLRVWAHSMGNIVLGEGLRKYNAVTHPKIKTYVATQAAIPGEAYDQSAPPAIFEDWVGFSHGPTTPRTLSFWYSGDASTTNQPYLSGNTAKVGKMCNYFNARDWALDWWESNNRMKPDDALNYGFAYGGMRSFYDETADVTNRFARCDWASIEGLEIVPEVNLVERYQVFAYCEESWSKALGQASNAMFSTTNVDLQNDPDLLYEHTHYSHSKEFRSNLPDQRKYYEYLMQDCNF